MNLLLPNQKQSKNPGDSKEMLEARKNFLNKGYYRPLSEKILSSIKKYMDKKDPALLSIFDAGCGEGYYLDCISRDDTINKSSILYGIDISKEGIRSAAKRNSNIYFAVGNVYNIPVADGSVNFLINVFAPFIEVEFVRILKDDGIIISVTPGANHLSGLKKILYDEVTLNDEELDFSEILYETDILRVNYELVIDNPEDISNLLKMTPYYHKTDREKIIHAIETLKELATPAEFIIRIFKKHLAKNNK